MQGDGLRGGSRLRKFRGDLFALAVQKSRLGTQNGRVSLPLRDGVNQTVNLTVKFAQPSLEPQTLAIRFGGKPFAFGVVSSNVFGDDFGVAEFGGQSIEYSRFYGVEIEGLRIWTYTTLSRGRAIERRREEPSFRSRKPAFARRRS